MKIVLDLTSLCRRQTGMEYYALNLSRALLENDAKNEYHLLFRNEVHPAFVSFSNRARLYLSPFKNQIATEQAWIPFMEKRIKPDVSHFPAFPPSPLLNRKQVATLFDSTLWEKRERLSWKAKAYLAPLSTRAVKKSQKILTISETAKKEIAEATGTTEEKLAVAHLAPDPIFLEPITPRQETKVIEKYQLPKHFILSVATLEPRKNLNGLLTAFAALSKKDPEAFLVLAGRMAWGKEEVLQTIVKLKLENKTSVLNYVPKEDLPALYALSDFLAFPSFHEGFGLPLVEAQAVGTPVLCSNTSSFPEVAGDSAYFVDPHSEESIAEGLEKVWNSPILCNELAQKGKANLNRFSWKKTAEKTLAAYAEAAGG